MHPPLTHIHTSGNAMTVGYYDPVKASSSSIIGIQGRALASQQECTLTQVCLQTINTCTHARTHTEAES